MLPGKTLHEKLSNAQAKIQTSINCFVDSESDKSILDAKSMGIKQVIKALNTM